MNRKPLISILSLVMAATMLIGILPTTAGAAKSSTAIQSELNVLKDKNKEIQSQINGIQRQ